MTPSTPAPGTLPALMPDEAVREELLTRLRAARSSMNTAAITAMDERNPWFCRLNPEYRSWINVLARAGIDGFITWYAGEEFAPESIFDAAPRAMAGRISLQQTVELVRTTTDVLQEQMGSIVPERHLPVVQLGCVHYSREIGFAAAGIYAKAAEIRGAWDSRIEATVVDAVVRAETDEAVLSRASTLGWDTDTPVAVAIGGAPDASGIEQLRRAARKLGVEMLAAIQGDRLVCIFGGPAITDPLAAATLVSRVEEQFAEGPVVVGPVASSLAGAPSSARAAASGYRAARAWPEGPRTMLSVDLLPERALAGDGHARRMLATEIYGGLLKVRELLDTCIGFLDNGSSMEATARALFVHPNTVRYRMKRIQEATGYNPTDPREAYILRIAITLGRLQG